MSPLADILQDLREDYSIRVMRQEGKTRKPSLSAVAKAMKIAASTLSDYENGKKIPSLDNAAKLAQFYGVPLDYLAGLTDSDKSINIEICLIQQKIGLSHKAIEALYSAPANVCNFISGLLESPHLQGLLQDLSRKGDEPNAT